MTELWRRLNPKISWLALNVAISSGEKTETQILNALTHLRGKDRNRLSGFRSMECPFGRSEASQVNPVNPESFRTGT